MASRRSYGTGSLFVVTDAAGRQAWYGKWRANEGRQVKRRLGPVRAAGEAAGLTKTQAEKRLRELMATLTPSAAAAGRNRPGRITVAELGDRYFAARRDLKTTTLRDYRMHVRLHLDPFFGITPVSAITADRVDELIRTLETRGLATKSIRTYITTLSTLLNHAVRKGWLDGSPMGAVDLPALPQEAQEDELRFLHPWEVDELVAAAGDGDYQDVDRALYRMAANCGLRQGELRGLLWKAVDLGGARVRVVRNFTHGELTTTKGKKTRSVPMSPAVVADLVVLRETSRWTRPSDRVFAHPATGGEVARTPLMRRYRVALVAAGLDPEFRFHDLRHTFGTTLAKAGVPVTDIQAWMGHQDLKTTERYLHYAPAHDDAARVARAFARVDPRGYQSGTNLSEPDVTQGALDARSAA